MFFNNLKIKYRYYIGLALALITLIWLLFFILKSANMASKTNQDIFAYTVKVQEAFEELDKVFERAEVNVNVMVDSISHSYNISKRLDKTYNLQFIDGINGLVKSVLSNSPNVNGSWFQINADLPFSAYAYNWYEFKENQFLSVKDQFAGTPSMNREITPDNDPYYFEAILNQKPTWSDIYIDADTKDAMMTISAPIYKEGILVGVVGIDISTTNLEQILANMQTILGKSELYLLDKKNNVILFKLSPNSSSIKCKPLFLDSFKNNMHGPIEYSDNLTKKTAIMLTLSNDYKIVISIKNQTLYSETNQIIKMLYVLFGLLIILFVVFFANQFKMLNLNTPQSIDEIINTETEMEETEEAIEAEEIASKIQE